MLSAELEISPTFDPKRLGEPQEQPRDSLGFVWKMGMKLNL